MRGNKLSKQNHAPALPEGDPRPEIVRALRFLIRISPGMAALSIDDLLRPSPTGSRQKSSILKWLPLSYD
jgi:hypothetical protein